MALSVHLFNWLRYVLGQGMHVVFAPEVRKNPTVVHAEVQSDDFTGGGRGARHKEQQSSSRRPETGAFKPQYVAPLRQPRTSLEAQRLYNHIRTLAFYLDAIPFFGRSLPFNIGFDSIVGIIPGIGDYIGLLLSLYALALSALFGLPPALLVTMIVNVVLDCVLGLVPLIGDALDVAFKANLRNLRLLEDHFIKTNGRCGAGNFDFQFPPSNVFMPPESVEPHATRAPFASSTAPSGLPVGSRGVRRSTRQENQMHSEAPADATAGRFTNILPDGQPRGDWTSTAGRYGPQDFRKGTAGDSGSIAGAQAAVGPVVPLHESTDSIDEIFTTMRYDPAGISIVELIQPLLDELGQSMPCNRDLTRTRCKMPLFSRHVTRLLSSLSAMKEAFPYDWQCVRVSAEPIRQAIEQHIAQQEYSPNGRRIRVAIRTAKSKDMQPELAHIHITSLALPASSPPSEGEKPKTVRVDTSPMILPTLHKSRETLALCHKTGNREVYDEARARVHATLGIRATSPATSNSSEAPPTPCFDVLMCARDADSKSILTESAIANIILLVHGNESDKRAQAFTPITVGEDGALDTNSLLLPCKATKVHPLLLPGLMRQELMEQGLVQPATLEVGMVRTLLKRGEASLFLCNALRGIVPVELE